MRPRSSRPSERLWIASLACALSAAACGGGRLHTRETPPGEDAGPVAPTDPTTAVPRAMDVASPGETVATLRAPIPDSVALALVERVFRTFHARTATLLEPDLDEYVLDLNPDGGVGGRQRASWIWELQNRLRNGAFDALEVDQMYRAADVEIYAYDELGLPGRPGRPGAMGVDEVLVRVPIATPRVGADVLFGEEVLLLLRRDGGRFKLRGYGERAPR